jgi:aconitate hydratase
MGVLPLQFLPRENPATLGLTGEETYEIAGLAAAIASNFASGKQIAVKSRNASGERVFKANIRIDTPQEVLYYQHGGILQYVLRQLVAGK